MTLFERRLTLATNCRDAGKRLQIHRAAQVLRDEYPDNGDGAFVLAALRSAGWPELRPRLDPSTLRAELVALGWREAATWDAIPDPGDLYWTVDRPNPRGPLVERIGVVVERPASDGRFVLADSEALSAGVLKRASFGNARLVRSIAEGWLLQPETKVDPPVPTRRRLEKRENAQEGV